MWVSTHLIYCPRKFLSPFPTPTFLSTYAPRVDANVMYLWCTQVVTLIIHYYVLRNSAQCCETFLSISTSSAFCHDSLSNISFVFSFFLCLLFPLFLCPPSFSICRLHYSICLLMNQGWAVVPWWCWFLLREKLFLSIPAVYFNNYSQSSCATLISCWLVTTQTPVYLQTFAMLLYLQDRCPWHAVTCTLP